MTDITDNSGTETVISDEQPINDNEVNGVEIIGQFFDLLDKGLQVDTAFVMADEDAGVFTHQVLYVSCGDAKIASQPEPLNIPLTPANIESYADVTVN